MHIFNLEYDWIVIQYKRSEEISKNQLFIRDFDYLF